jgi:hypothetical protein
MTQTPSQTFALLAAASPGAALRLSPSASQRTRTRGSASATSFASAANRNITGAGNLPVEEFARYGDDVLVKATVQYLATPALVLIVEGNGHWAQGNRFPRDSAYYDSGRTSLEAEVGFVYQVFLGVYVSGSVSYLQVKEAADAALAEDTTYHAFKGSLHLATFFK